METEELTEKQPDITDKRMANILPHMWKKGQSGNVHGRPKGKTMKEWAREYLERLTDEERDAFMEGIPKETFWKMAEGNPHQDNNSSGEIKIINVNVPAPLAQAFAINATTNSETSGSNTEQV